MCVPELKISLSLTVIIELVQRITNKVFVLVVGLCVMVQFLQFPPLLLQGMQQVIEFLTGCVRVYRMVSVM